MRRTAALSSLTASILATSSAGTSVPDNSANRRIWPYEVIGMIPGMIGMSQPIARTRSTSRW